MGCQHLFSSGSRHPVIVAVRAKGGGGEGGRMAGDWCSHLQLETARTAVVLHQIGGNTVLFPNNAQQPCFPDTFQAQIPIIWRCLHRIDPKSRKPKYIRKVDDLSTTRFPGGPKDAKSRPWATQFLASPLTGDAALAKSYINANPPIRAAAASDISQSGSLVWIAKWGLRRDCVVPIAI